MINELKIPYLMIDLVIAILFVQYFNKIDEYEQILEKHKIRQFVISQNQKYYH